MVTRRSFLHTTAGVAGFAGAAAAFKRQCLMRFGFTTYQWGKPWTIPEIIANCRQARAFAVELRTSQNYAHGVELELTAAGRREVKLRFIDSPVMLIGLACGERFDSPDAAKLKTAIEQAKAYAKLSHDVGGTGLRVFPNDFHEGVPHEQTVAQIARSLNEVGRYAADYGQQIRLENHGRAGRLTTLRQIMEQVDQSNVRLKLNGDARDSEGFAESFHQVKQYLGDTLHSHDYADPKFPYQLQTNLLIDAGWDGWCLVENSDQVPDRVEALIAQRKMFEQMVEKSLARP
jgi:xylose isomerase-like TIM barrel protein